MSKLEITLSALLLISALMNVGLIIYVRTAIAQLLSISEELGDLQSMIDTFAKHVASVYELEMFYGDETLQHLMEHAVDLNEVMGNFEYIYSLTEKEREELEEIEDESRRTEADETEETPQTV